MKSVAALSLTASCLIWLAGVAGLIVGKFRINVTPSAAYGLWQIQPLDGSIEAGDQIFVCPPQGIISQVGLLRGYLPRGLCPSGTAPLIKTVLALPGQLVEIGDYVEIDGKRLANSLQLPVDARGRTLIPHEGGRVPDGALYLHSDYPGSYDSRYFGPIPADGVLGRAIEVITFAP